MTMDDSLYSEDSEESSPCTILSRVLTPPVSSRSRGINVQPTTADEIEAECLPSKAIESTTPVFATSPVVANAKERTMVQPEQEGVDCLGPEDLVRRETKVVNFLRAILLIVKVIVGAFLSVGIYKLETTWEQETFHRDFDAISSRFAVAFTTELGRMFLNAHSLGNTISTSSDMVAAAPNITMPLNDLAAGDVQTSHFYRAFWSPLISSAKQRHGWEAYARDQMSVLSAWNDYGTECFPCGSPDLEVGAPNAEVEFPIGAYTCGNIQWGAQKGLVSPAECLALVPFVQANCQCRPVVGGLANINKTDLPARSQRIYEVGRHGFIPAAGPGPFSPVWQVYPSADWASVALFDLFSDPAAREALNVMISTERPVISKTFHSTTPSLWSKLLPDTDPRALSLLFSPVVVSTVNASQILGSIVFELDWAYLLGTSLPVRSKGVHVVIENTFGQMQTFSSTGKVMRYVGEGDLHDPVFSSMVAKSTFEDYFTVKNHASPSARDNSSRQECAFRVRVYPSVEFRSNYVTNRPRMYAMTIALIFVFTSTLFVVYDCYVAQRQRKVMRAALQRDEIVSSLFPSKVRERLFQVKGKTTGNRHDLFYGVSPTAQLRNLLSTSTRAIRSISHMTPTPEPIADFFPNVTVVFADISGFTAWSSEREPSQVFQLLETLFQAFDKLARRFGVFKIETIGDCYVAAAGVPAYQPDHAVRVVKFAYECLLHMHELTHELEAVLGPSTSSLSIRIGVHSGPVIAGVLRGEKSRFQLFGDTMNTAARMQMTGETSMIQISAATAHLLEQAGHSDWIKAREERVALEGKGLVPTYWADPFVASEHADVFSQSVTFVPSMDVQQQLKPWGASTHSRMSNRIPSDVKRSKMVSWNTDLLMRFLKTVVATRNVSKKRVFHLPRRNSQISGGSNHRFTPFENVTEIIPMQEFCDKVARAEIDLDEVEIGKHVRAQLLDYISTIASMYHDNPFHNFEHASHVAMSAAKVVSRIIKPDLEYANHHDNTMEKGIHGRVAFQRSIHDNTFGISSDVLMQFAVVFSAIIHDVDHTGVSNEALIKEAQLIALQYDNKCVAEQNSVDIAWRLLMQEKYKDLRQLICANEQEQQRFRQLLVNAVIATDIADKELQQRRKKRWDKAFHCGSEASSDFADFRNDMDRKATIVFEYIIQASDVAHTMQHWNIYKLWNERLFEERYLAFLQGRESADPSKGWYQGEIWFFDNYIIPLAKKLETCGVFGVSSDEYLSYALENRHEWELKGEDIVRGLVEKYGSSRSSISDDDLSPDEESSTTSSASSAFEAIL